MIKSIELKNIQSHENTRLEFDSGDTSKKIEIVQNKRRYYKGSAINLWY